MEKRSLSDTFKALTRLKGPNGDGYGLAKVICLSTTFGMVLDTLGVWNIATGIPGLVTGTAVLWNGLAGAYALRNCGRILLIDDNTKTSSDRGISTAFFTAAHSNGSLAACYFALSQALVESPAAINAAKAVAGISADNAKSALIFAGIGLVSRLLDNKGKMSP